MDGIDYDCERTDFPMGIDYLDCENCRYGPFGRDVVEMIHPFADLTEEEMSIMVAICREILESPAEDLELGDWVWWIMMLYKDGEPAEAWTLDHDQRIVNTFKPQPVMFLDGLYWNLDLHCDEDILQPGDAYGPHKFSPGDDDILIRLPLMDQWMKSEVWDEHDAVIEVLFLPSKGLFIVKDVLDTELARHQNPHYACCLAAHTIKSGKVVGL
jgi:hypothetical protein